MGGGRENKNVGGRVDAEGGWERAGFYYQYWLTLTDLAGLSNNRRDEKVKNVHYILVPKPWERRLPSPLPSPAVDMEDGRGEGVGAGEKEVRRDDDETDKWWREVDMERRRWEAERGLG
jgi:hypothetical protein